jgi:hypothetical protein
MSTQEKQFKTIAGVNGIILHVNWISIIIFKNNWYMIKKSHFSFKNSTASKNNKKKKKLHIYLHTSKVMIFLKICIYRYNKQKSVATETKNLMYFLSNLYVKSME